MIIEFDRSSREIILSTWWSPPYPHKWFGPYSWVLHRGPPLLEEAARHNNFPLLERIFSTEILPNFDYCNGLDTKFQKLN